MNATTQPEEAPDPAESEYKLAWKALEAGRYTAALSHIDKAIALCTSPDTTSVYWATKGGFLNRGGFHNEAVKACEIAVQLQALNHWAWSQLGLAHLRLHAFPDAARCLAKAAELRPEKSVYTLLARSQLEFDPAQALQSAEIALLYDPSWEEAKRIRNAAIRRLTH